MVGACLGAEVGEVYGLGYRGCYRLHVCTTLCHLQSQSNMFLTLMKKYEKSQNKRSICVFPVLLKVSSGPVQCGAPNRAQGKTQQSVLFLAS